MSDIPDNSSTKVEDNANTNAPDVPPAVVSTSNITQNLSKETKVDASTNTHPPSKAVRKTSGVSVNTTTETRGQTDTKNDYFKIHVSTPGKVILFGEHSVVYEKRALASSLGLRTTVALEEECNPQNSIIIKLFAVDVIFSFTIEELQLCLLEPCRPHFENLNLDSPEAADYQNFIGAIKGFFKYKMEILRPEQYNAIFSVMYLFITMLAPSVTNWRPFFVSAFTDMTIGSGLGSSASLMVAVSAAFYQYCRYKTEKTKNEFTEKDLDIISRWAFAGEKFIHGTPSGLDNTICTYGSLVKFRKGVAPKLIPFKNTVRILLVNTKVPKDTKAQVAKVAALRSAYTDIIDGVLWAMDRLAKRATLEFRSLNEMPEDAPKREHRVAEIYKHLVELVELNQHLLKTLQVSHPALDNVCAILQEYGLKGKLTGGGGGGYAFAIIPEGFDKAVLDKIPFILEKHGYEGIITSLGGPGLKIDKFIIN